MSTVLKHLSELQARLKQEANQKQSELSELENVMMALQQQQQQPPVMPQPMMMPEAFAHMQHVYAQQQQMAMAQAQAQQTHAQSYSSAVATPVQQKPKQQTQLRRVHVPKPTKKPGNKIVLNTIDAYVKMYATNVMPRVENGMIGKRLYDEDDPTSNKFLRPLIGRLMEMSRSRKPRFGYVKVSVFVNSVAVPELVELGISTFTAVEMQESDNPVLNELCDKVLDVLSERHGDFFELREFSFFKNEAQPGTVNVKVVHRAMLTEKEQRYIETRCGFRRSAVRPTLGDLAQYPPLSSPGAVQEQEEASQHSDSNNEEEVVQEE